MEGRGFGFARPDHVDNGSAHGGADIFVHARDIANADKLSQGQRVSFEIITDENRRGKLRCIHVRVI